MALTVETGSGVTGADSYVTLAEARAYALSRGVTLPAADADLEVLCRKGTDYLETFRSRFIGAKVNGQGYLQWPRKQSDGTGVVIDGTQLDTVTIPVELKRAQMQAVCEMVSTPDLLPTATGPAVQSETLDVISTTYAVAPGSLTMAPKLRKVDAILEPLLVRSGQGLRSVRV